MRLDLLAKVADHLENVSDDNFNMDYWWNKETGCGCAIGNSAELLREADKRFVLIDDIDDLDSLQFPVYYGDDGWSSCQFAIARLFEISKRDAEYLFFNSDNEALTSREAVIKRIRDFVYEKRNNCLNPDDESEAERLYDKFVEKYGLRPLSELKSEANGCPDPDFYENDMDWEV